MQKPTIEELAKKYLNNYKPTFDGLEFDGQKFIGKKNSNIKPKHAKLFIKEVNQYYPIKTLNERVIIETSSENDDIYFYLERYFLGNGFKYYSD